MGSIFQDKQGYWRGAVNLPKDLDGKRKKKIFYGDTDKTVSQQKKELQAQITNLEYEINNNLYAHESNDTLEKYLNEWYKVYTVGKAETTRQLYKFYMDKHIIPELGPLKIKEIMPIQLQKFYNLKSEKLSGKTVGKLHSFLNMALKPAIKNRIIKYNPCDGVDKPKSKKFSPVVYNEANFNKLTALTQGTFDEVCILLAGVCGFRRGEVFGLRLIDIDFKECKISVEETQVRFTGPWIIKDPKSESGKRKIKVPSFVIEVIADYLKTLKVVPERICGKYKPSSYSQHFKKLLKDNGLPHIRFHDLRHFNASLMMRYNIPDTIAAGRLGHAQVEMTRKYQHSSSEMDNEAASTIEDVFLKSRKVGS